MEGRTGQGLNGGGRHVRRGGLGGDRVAAETPGLDQVTGLFMKNWEDDDDSEYLLDAAGSRRRGLGVPT